MPETQPHIENWLENIKTRGRCTADIFGLVTTVRGPLGEAEVGRLKAHRWVRNFYA